MRRSPVLMRMLQYDDPPVSADRLRWHCCAEAHPRRTPAAVRSRMLTSRINSPCRAGAVQDTVLRSSGCLLTHTRRSLAPCGQHLCQVDWKLGRRQRRSLPGACWPALLWRLWVASPNAMHRVRGRGGGRRGLHEAQAELEEKCDSKEASYPIALWLSTGS